MSLSSVCTVRLLKEYQSLLVAPIEGISVRLAEEHVSTLLADLCGPEGTPFEGGNFVIRLQFGPDFPSSPPKAMFLTRIFHPNVSKTGEICVNALKKDWKASHGVRHILLVIRCLLIVPNPESALNEDAGKLLLENYDDYAKRAALMTKIHAKTKGNENQEKEKEKEENSRVASDELNNQENGINMENAKQNEKNNEGNKSAVQTIVQAPAAASGIQSSSAATKKKPLKRL
jgi:ubiquitin-conjugating enzyme E2 S